MPDMKVKVYHCDSRFAEVLTLELVHEFTFIDFPENADEKLIQLILDKLFEDFNNCITYLGIDYFVSGNRSLSMGDVLVLGETAWQCDSIGWSIMPTSVLQNAINEGDAK